VPQEHCGGRQLQRRKWYLNGDDQLTIVIGGDRPVCAIKDHGQVDPSTFFVVSAMHFKILQSPQNFILEPRHLQVLMMDHPSGLAIFELPSGSRCDLCGKGLNWTCNAWHWHCTGGTGQLHLYDTLPVHLNATANTLHFGWYISSSIRNNCCIPKKLCGEKVMRNIWGKTFNIIEGHDWRHRQEENIPMWRLPDII